MARSFQVTGTPAGATKYTAALLTELGVPCVHEKFFNPRKIDLEGPLYGSSWLAAPFLPFMLPETLILHQYRDKQKTVESLVRMRILHDPTPGDVVWNRFYRYYTPPRSSDPYQMASDFYDDWHELIDRNSRGFQRVKYRVEEEGADPEFWYGIIRAIDERNQLTVERVAHKMTLIRTDMNHHEAPE